VSTRKEHTPDGVASDDSDIVHELAVEIVNASFVDDTKRGEIAKRKLYGVLDELEERYGALPSILATRADYVEDRQLREELLLRAYSEAKIRRDARNMVWVASSLAALYTENLRDYDRAGHWLDVLADNLLLFPDDSVSEELQRLRVLVTKRS
jgi:hypothetical protein